MSNQNEDTAAPKGKKAKKGAKKAGPKLVASQVKPGIGHNSGKVIPELVSLLDEITASQERQKTEAKLQRDLRNKAKVEFGVLSSVLADQLRKRKMDPDVRVQFESGIKDLEVAIGYQAQLDFAGATPTKASVAAQPTEAELAARQGNEVEGTEQPKEPEQAPQQEPAVISRAG